MEMERTLAVSSLPLLSTRATPVLNRDPSSAWLLRPQFAEHPKPKSDLTGTLLLAGTFGAMTSFKERPNNLNVAEDRRGPRARDI